MVFNNPFRLSSSNSKISGHNIDHMLTLEAFTDVDEVGDLFGALVRRKVNPESTLYQDSGLFHLSLPALDANSAPDIFSKAELKVGRNRGDVDGFSEKKACDDPVKAPQSPQLVPNLIMSDAPATIATPSVYFSLTTKNQFTASLSKDRLDFLSEEYVSTCSLLALKGIPSKLFQLATKTPVLYVPGYTATSMVHNLSTMRGNFIMRCVLTAACEGLNGSEDPASRAVGAQLTTLLHVLDTSVAAQLSSISSSVDPKAATIATADRSIPGRGRAAGGLIAMMQRTAMHRAFLAHLFTALCCLHTKHVPSSISSTVLRSPDVLAAYTTTGALSSGDATMEAHNALTQLLSPRTWSTLGGWSLLHTLTAMFNQHRQRNHATFVQPILQQSLFANSRDFAPPGRPLEVVSDVMRTVLTAALVQHVAVPLLAQLRGKLYALDADFLETDKVSDSELSESLSISVESLWRACLWQEDANSDETGGGPEDLVTFLVAALAWARGRVQLMLLESTETTRTDTSNAEHPSRITKLGNKLLPVPVRADAPNRIAKNRRLRGSRKDSTEVGFDRLSLIREFRLLKADSLLLPITLQDEAGLYHVRQQSDALHKSLQKSVSDTIGAWYEMYATMSDYYNDHAVKAKTMFADVDYHIRPSVPQPRPPAPPKMKNKSARADAADTESRSASTEVTRKGKIGAPQSNTSDVIAKDTVILTTEVLGAKHEVSAALVAEAEQHIRTKYNALMRGVESRITATAWRKRQMQTLPAARLQLAALFAEDEIEYLKLRAAKLSSPDKYQAFLHQQQVVPQRETPLPPQRTEEATRLLDERAQVPTEDQPVKELGHFGAQPSGAASDAQVVPSHLPAAPFVPTVSEMEDLSAAQGNATDAPASRTEFDTVSTDASEASSGGDVISAAASVDIAASVVNTDAVNVADASTAANQTVVPKTVSAEELSAPLTKLEDLAQPLLHPDSSYLAAEECVYDDICSLSQALLRLGSQCGVLNIAVEDIEPLVRAAAADAPTPSDAAVLTRVLQTAGQPANLLHSLRTIFLRSLGQAVLVQCRALNLAAAHCLMNGTADLLGHIRTVDNQFLVSPSSDFLMSLCSHAVEQHLQGLRVLQRQSGAPLTALSHQFLQSENACLWNAEALKLSFSATMRAASEGQEWKEYGSRFAALTIATTASNGASHYGLEGTDTLVTSVAEITKLWSEGLFSASGLAELELSYRAPWPVPAILSPVLLRQFGAITCRFLELGQLVSLFRTVWAEMRLQRVQKSRPTARTMKKGKKKIPEKTPSGEVATSVGNAEDAAEVRARKAAEREEWQARCAVDRCLCASMRLVQQVVQLLFDYLSERVYVHQSQFKIAMLGAREHGLDGIVCALGKYASSLAFSALQLTTEERSCLLRLGANFDPAVLLREDPSLSMKTAFNAVLESCRQALRCAKALNEIRGKTAVNAMGVVVMPPLDEPLEEIMLTCGQIQAHRATLVQAAERVSAYDMSQGDLQSLIMRLAV